MITVKNLLKDKGKDIWTVSPDTPVFYALELMASKDIGAIVVIQDGKLVGILSERDYARKVILKGKSSRNTLVKEIMTSDVITVRPRQTMIECMVIMNRYRIRYLPVVEKSELLGVISIGDVLEAIITEQAEEISSLRKIGLDTEI